MSKYIFILSVFAALVFAGCDTEKVAKLDNSVDARINALIDGYVDELIASEYGWMVSVKTSEGYYRYWMKFYEGNVVEMYTDNIHYPNYKTEVETTTYAFMAFQRPTLVFDTYCYMSIPNDPDDDISYGKNNKGLVTDFEFEVVRYDAENQTFHMQGRFNKGNAILRPATQQDMKNAGSGLMMDVVNNTYQDTRWVNKYIHGTTSAGAEVAVKLYDNRNMYLFVYDGRTGLTRDELSYFNTEIDGSGDLVFPEPVELGEETITGVMLDGGDFVEFYTESGDGVPLSITNTPPTIPLEDLFGVLDDQGKMYNSFTTTSDVVTSLVSGITYDALYLFPKFFAAFGSINLVSTYDQVYYISQDPGDGQYYLTMTMTPLGLGISFETWTSVTSFPTGTYRFKLSNINWNELTFMTDAPQLMDAGAREYYNNGITRPIVDGLRSKTLKLQWSEVGVPRGMIVELKAANLSEADNHKLNFIPPAILTKR